MERRSALEMWRMLCINTNPDLNLEVFLRSFLEMLDLIWLDGHLSLALLSSLKMILMYLRDQLLNQRELDHASTVTAVNIGTMNVDMLSALLVLLILVMLHLPLKIVLIWPIRIYSMKPFHEVEEDIESEPAYVNSIAFKAEEESEDVQSYFQEPHSVCRSSLPIC